MAAVVEDNKAPANTAEDAGPAEDDMPKLPPFKARPDKYSYEQTINELNNEIESIKMKRGKILKTIKARQSGGAGFREKKIKHASNGRLSQDKERNNGRTKSPLCAARQLSVPLPIV